MGGNNEDDGFMLNVNLSNASKRNTIRDQQPSKKQQRPRSWADKKNAKVCFFKGSQNIVEKHSSKMHSADFYCIHNETGRLIPQKPSNNSKNPCIMQKNPQQGRGSRSGAGRSSSPPPPPPSAAQDNLLKGYALDLPSPPKPRARSSDLGYVDFDDIPPNSNKILSLEDGGNTRDRSQPRKRSRNTLQSASAPQQQNMKSAYEKPSKRIGRIRLASRMAGDREATPDQDDIRPIEEDDDNDHDNNDEENMFGKDEDGGSKDIMAAVVAAAVARDKLVEKELAIVNAERKKLGIPTADEYHSSDNDDDVVAAELAQKGDATGGGGNATGGGYPGGGVYSSGANNMPLGERPQLLDGQGNEIVDFDYGGNAYPEFREKTKKKRARWESVGGPVPSVKPGMLTHTGGGNRASMSTAAAEEVFGLKVSNKNSSKTDAAPITTTTATTTIQQNSSSLNTFEGLGLCSALSTHLESLGFTTPTAVQRSTIPIVLSGKDALVNAPTGSGKTLSYLAPIMHDLASIEPRITRADGTLALIICPTRELCLQVVDTLTLLSRRFFWIVPGSVHGGENRAKEKARLRKGVSVLVTTPGRLLDHLQNTESFRIDKLKWLVLDEADRLLDLGFEKKIAQILAVIEEKSSIMNSNTAITSQQNNNDYTSGSKIRRKTILLSATLHGGLGGLAGLSLHQPEAIGWEMEIDKKTGKLLLNEGIDAFENITDGGAIGDGGGGDGLQNIKKMAGYSIPTQLKQQFVQIPCKLRLVALAAMIRMKIITGGNTKAKVVVFFSNCDSVEFHHAVLSSGAWSAASGQALLPPSAPLLKLHGNMPQAERTASLLSFTKAGAGVLLCTDVAARGLDFPAVTAIIQFDPPGTAEEYVHRVGRTARLGQSGEALLFIQPTEKGYVDKYLKSQQVNLQEESSTTALDRTLGMDPKAGKGLPIERHHGAYRLQKEVMDAVDSDPKLKILAETAFRSSVRAYATHSLELKPYFNVRTLHIGHLAHSFALKASPAMVGKSSTGEEARKRRQEDFRKGGGGGKKFKQKHQQQQQQQSPAGKDRKERKAGPGGKYQGFTPVKSGKGGYVLS
jgi:ATP-dependent RNA helicase DDX31/DBP7